MILVGGWRFVTYRLGSGVETAPSWVRACSNLIAWMSGGTLLILLAAGAAEDLTVPSILWIVSLGVGRVARSAASAVRSSGSGTFRHFLRQMVSSALGRVSLTVKCSAAIFAPNGWSEIRIGSDVVDRVFSVRTIVYVYIAGLVVLPMLLSAVLVSAARSGTPIQQEV
ncbi:MAG: hypothetical protein Q4P24_18245, partial [Rhodobacterales bacterium]|nr:hypothetical protein [Rhodobacterales bacterium]